MENSDERDESLIERLSGTGFRETLVPEKWVECKKGRKTSMRVRGGGPRGKRKSKTASEWMKVHDRREGELEDHH